VTVVDGRIAEISRGVAGWAPWFNPFVAFLRAEDPEFAREFDRTLDLELESQREVLERLPEFLERYEDWVRSQEG
jgi:hypothetical protein